MADRPLTPRQESFVLEYLKDFNATAAAERAGYSDPNIGRQLITKSNVQAAIQAVTAKRAQEAHIEGVRVLKEYAAIAFGDIREIFYTGEDGGVYMRPINEWPETTGRALAGIKVRRSMEKRPDGSFEPIELMEFRLNSKTEALRDLAKHLGLLKESPQLPLTDDGKAVAIRVVEAVKPESAAKDSDGEESD